MPLRQNKGTERPVKGIFHQILSRVAGWSSSGHKSSISVDQPTTLLRFDEVS